jgi:hypothetical protein
MSLAVTVLVSAAVSGLVALAIEYAAKPRLEARKEELLELHRRRRELKAMLLKINTLAAMWAPYVDAHASELDSEMSRALEQLDQMTCKLWDDIEWYAGTFSSLQVFNRPSLQNLVIQYILGARAIYLSDMPRPDKLRILGEISEPLQVAFAERWPITKGRALARLPEGTHSEIVWLLMGRIASTRANARRLTGLPNTYARSAG